MALDLGNNGNHRRIEAWGSEEDYPIAVARNIGLDDGFEPELPSTPWLIWAYGLKVDTWKPSLLEQEMVAQLPARCPQPVGSSAGIRLN